MMSRRLYCAQITQGNVCLDPDESHHALRVLRLQAGDEISLFDGVGTQAQGVITQIDRRSVRVEVQCLNQHPFDLLHQVTLAVAFPKHHRQGYLIEKCTELGVANLWIITTQRSVVRPKEGTLPKWHRRAIEACKQSGRTWAPSIEGPKTFDNFVAAFPNFNTACLAVVGETSQSLSEVLKSCSTDRLSPAPTGAETGHPASGVSNVPGVSVLIGIGPEGGWTAEEIDQATRAGAVPASLGPTVLRTETAAVAACAIACVAAAGKLKTGN